MKNPLRQKQQPQKKHLPRQKLLPNNLKQLKVQHKQLNLKQRTLNSAWNL